MDSSVPKLRVAIVPEHFSIPFKWGVEKKIFEKHGVEIVTEEFPRGTGSMCRSLRNNEIEVAVALTEGIISDIATNGKDIQLVSTYVQSPLHWGIVVDKQSDIKTVEDLKGRTIGISRLGSGSHLMSFLLALRHQWNLNELKFVPQGGLHELLDGLKQKKCDVFMWERFMTKHYVDEGIIRSIGEIVTPWPCFMIAVRKDIVDKHSEYIKKFLDAVKECAKEFKDPKNEKLALEHISHTSKLTLEDAKKWYEGVQFSQNGDISGKILEDAVSLLKKAGVLTEDVNIQDLYSSKVVKLID